MARARIRMLSLITGGAMLTGGLVTTAASSATAAAPSAPTVVATGLNNPRHLTFTRDGRLLVAESGTGGAGPCIMSSEGSQVCYGPTGSVTELVRYRGVWHQRRMVTGLPSLASQVDDPANNLAKGGSATGPSDVEALGSHYLVSVGLGAPPSARDRGQATKSPTSTT
ncbi:MAG TPA: ScyD/ScyE family protein, partial [Actinomycetales bacterium]|nr:ScyD/ScyE family protein [Actinomycetales bacterium]